VIVLLLTACAPLEKPNDDDTAGPDTGSVDDGSVALTDAQNYTYEIDLDIQEAPLAASADAVVDWSTLDRDIWGQPVIPGNDVRSIDLLWLRDLDEAGVEEAIVTGSFNQASIGLLAQLQPSPGQTSAALADLQAFGGPFNANANFIAGEGTWLLRVETFRSETAMAQFVVPADAPDRVDLRADSATLHFTPSLEGVTPIALGADSTLAWDGLTRDGRGAPIDPLQLQMLVLARYQGDILTDLARQFFSLEDVADEVWTAEVYGHDRIDVASALDAAGEPFPGPDDLHPLLLSLRCADCAAPTPSFLGLVVPE
jgi:hypothetical protein